MAREIIELDRLGKEDSDTGIELFDDPLIVWIVGEVDRLFPDTDIISGDIPIP